MSDYSDYSDYASDYRLYDYSDYGWGWRLWLGLATMAGLPSCLVQLAPSRPVRLGSWPDTVAGGPVARYQYAKSPYKPRTGFFIVYSVSILQIHETPV